MAEPENAEPIDFIESAAEPSSATRRSVVLDLPVEIVVSVGSARLSVLELMNLKKDQIVSLDSRIADPVDILVGERLVARGELVDLDGDEGGVGVRLTDIVEAAKAG
jgi:flagellar motor switch protein FliN/FliY